MIGIDWGTTSLRAYRLDEAGAVLEHRESAQGILSVPGGGFAAVLDAEIRPWLDAGERLVLLCGMIGSRQGWQEAPYLPCPAGPAEIAAAMVPLPFPGAARCLLVPGLLTRGPEGVPDVMRGEETKLVGLLAELGDGAAATLCLPGTHSKWARLDGGRITGFATRMTGEVRAVLLGHSILGRLSAPAQGPADEAFRRGLRRSRERGGLLHHLFGTRALGLVGELAPEGTDEYLSGLLIGHEVRAAVEDGAPGTVHLAGSATLCRLYALAFAEYGIRHRQHDPDIAARGLALLGRTIG
ncbi:MAG: 2-dehydro-3-deoxygalactonokinase [uncultured Acetobacteraceae bacterium]|uniref:2-dehydro-3-deoxygalactonokinase n=1 Tax=uncultured Acetobacteraceae bacterium TaxID=169975 RepID=A0A6J4HZY0_9PROT|nr:MAG: 2-dehydro-3-deoxygalactonokinase [uncultured Acetobacteraceae bacterium]